MENEKQQLIKRTMEKNNEIFDKLSDINDIIYELRTKIIEEDRALMNKMF